MKTLLVAAALSLAATGAFAAEGGGDPFAFHVTEQPVQTAPLAYHGVPKDQNPYPFTVPSVGWNTTRPLPVDGSEGVVQTANSLPPGFENGTEAYQRGQELQAWRLAHTAQPTRSASLASR